MMRGAKFWIPMAVFQVIFGLAVFGVTRQHYSAEPRKAIAAPSRMSPSIPVWPGSITDADLAKLGAPIPNTLNYDDPFEISRHANASFSNKQYDRAAELYELLLPFDPDNVDTYNNLGITLHYLGRSDEALARLREGVAVDPAHQRIRLTLGFVNSQLGNIDDARTALTTAAALGAGNEVGQSAAKMLENLP